ncbi:MAG TPA: type II toxin-antitoxin system RelE/ParE family toxin [Polyangia bacterium]
MAARRSSLVWTAPALDDLDDVAAWIALENATAAGELVAQTLAAVERLRRFPASGRWVPELSSRIYRELIVPPLRVIYRRERAGVLIVHVMRGERQLHPDRLRRGG